MKLLIVGSGQLGSRHLQGACQSESISEILVVDPDESSLATARTRLDDVGSICKVPVVNFQTDLSKASKKFDIAIVATNSDVRASVVTSIVNDCRVRLLILEKFLFSKRSEYQEIGTLLKSSGALAWVNCPRRAYLRYQDIRAHAKTRKSPLSMSVIGGEWGMACNAIHFLDLFSFLIGTSEINAEGAFLDKEPYPSKRLGFSEVSGAIVFSSKQGDRVFLQSTRGAPASTILTIKFDDQEYILDESKGKMWQPGAGVEEFKLPFQSQTTGPLVSHLAQQNICDLTPYEESAGLHLALFDVMASYLTGFGFATADHCPIT